MSSEKERVDTRVNSALLKAFRLAVVEKHGGLYGHMGKSLEEAMRMWLGNPWTKKKKET